MDGIERYWAAIPFNTVQYRPILPTTGSACDPDKHRVVIYCSGNALTSKKPFTRPTASCHEHDESRTPEPSRAMAVLANQRHDPMDTSTHLEFIWDAAVRKCFFHVRYVANTSGDHDRIMASASAWPVAPPLARMSSRSDNLRHTGDERSKLRWTCR